MAAVCWVFSPGGWEGAGSSVCGLCGFLSLCSSKQLRLFKFFFSIIKGVNMQALAGLYPNYIQIFSWLLNVVQGYSHLSRAEMLCKILHYVKREKLGGTNTIFGMECNLKGI